MQRKVLLVIVPDAISSIVKKGEYCRRYYNPGDLFDEVHILMINNDEPERQAMQYTVGSAQLHLHNLSAGRGVFVATLGWQPPLLRLWAATAVKLAATIKPQLIRCYGLDLNAFAASAIKRSLGIPYVVSLHGNPDVDYYRGRLGRTWRDRLKGRAIARLEQIAICEADMVLPVYSPIESFLKRSGVSRYEVIYNSVGYGCKPRQDYRLNKNRVTLVCVARQDPMQKDQSPILEAVAQLPNVHLTLVGQGPLHKELIAKAAALKLGDRVTFIRSMPNDGVIDLMRRADFYVYSSINYEIAKSCIEAALMGLPTILNDRDGDPARELTDAGFHLVENTAAGYRDALVRFIEDDKARECLGRRLALYSHEHFDPVGMEQRVADIYRKLAKDDL